MDGPAVTQQLALVWTETEFAKDIFSASHLVTGEELPQACRGSEGASVNT
jgi:hypothetical protein